VIESLRAVHDEIGAAALFRVRQLLGKKRCKFLLGHSGAVQRAATLVRGFDAWAAAMPPGRRLTVTTDLAAALRGAHAVMALRLQQERMASGLLPSLREYAMRYGLTVETLRLARADALVMHPGPMNEGVEIAPELADFERSVVTEQVANGVAIRMALLYLLAGTGPIEEGRVRG